MQSQKLDKTLTLTDKELVEGIKNRDAQIFRQFVDAYQVMVRNTCMGFVNNHEDTDDLAQEVFIEVFNSIGHFRGTSKLSTWIYRIAINKSLNFLRNNKKRLAAKDLETKKDIPDNNNYANPDANIKSAEDKLALKSALRSLPRNQRIAFTLNKQENHSYKEISEIMDTSVSSVESLIHRAKQNLQKKLINFYKK
ncbi:MAG: RNA polymerase sigma factor [Bacteroidales bacterium]|nr:RNA polymerase sigma factor [Bacteroidales bacterium]